jgi:hypothetical protein
MIQISVNSLFQYLSITTACKMFRTLIIVCELNCVDLGFFIHKSKSGDIYIEIGQFQLAVVLYCIVMHEKLVLLF